MAVVVVIVVVLLVVWLLRRKGRSKYDLSKASEMEMGTKKPKKPVLGGEWREGGREGGRREGGSEGREGGRELGRGGEGGRK